jgi:hypothetical protein
LLEGVLVGSGEGNFEGCSEGSLEGSKNVGASEGLLDGWDEGELVGCSEGALDGRSEGSSLRAVHSGSTISLNGNAMKSVASQGSSPSGLVLVNSITSYFF